MGEQPIQHGGEYHGAGRSLRLGACLDQSGAGWFVGGIGYLVETSALNHLRDIHGSDGYLIGRSGLGS